MARQITDAAMQKATGYGSEHWFPILDAMAEDGMERKDIVMKFWKTYDDDLSAWWAQMTTVEWERDRGRRVLNQSCSGSFQMSAQKTFVGDEMAAWDAVVTTDWLSGLKYQEGFEFSHDGYDLTVRAVRPGKMLRLWWQKDEYKSVLEVMFVPAKEKCAIRFQHQKLADEIDVDIFKNRWKAVLADIVS